MKIKIILFLHSILPITEGRRMANIYILFSLNKKKCSNFIALNFFLLLIFFEDNASACLLSSINPIWKNKIPISIFTIEFITITIGNGPRKDSIVTISYGSISSVKWNRYHLFSSLNRKSSMVFSHERYRYTNRGKNAIFRTKFHMWNSDQ